MALILPRGTAETGNMGSAPAASWLSRAEMSKSRWAYEQGRILLGVLPQDESVNLGVADDRHLVTIAGSRAGKSTTSIIPNLMIWGGSALVIDPKGELAAQTAAKRREFGRVVVLDPFGVSGEESGNWNLFDDLEGLPPDLIPDEVATIAEALITGSGGNNDYWNQAARILVRCVLLGLLATEEKPTLALMRKIISSGEGLIDTLSVYVNSEAYDGLLSRLAAGLLATEPRERSAIISTAATQTSFLDSPGLSKISSSSDFSLFDFKDEVLTVYLVLPSGRMASHFRWLRLFIDMALQATERNPTKPELPVLWVLEEFAQLGYMKALESAAGYMAGFGVKLWLVLQDLPQLQNHYRQSWETFLGNAGIIQAFANNDRTTLNYLSDKLGETTVSINDTYAMTSSSMMRSSGETSKTSSARLLTAFELANALKRENSNALVIVAGEKPLIVNRKRWEWWAETTTTDVDGEANENANDTDGVAK